MPRKRAKPADVTFTRTTFELRFGDGAPPVRGDVRVRTGTAPGTAVVICHGFKGFRTWGTWPSLARAIARHGHAAVTFDFSHNGVGADGVDFSALDLFREQTHTRNVREIRHLLDALESGRLLEKAPRRVGLLGHSRGGGEAILAAAEDPRVSALVTWASIADLAARWTAEQAAAFERGEDVFVENSRTKQKMPIGPAYWRDVREHAAKLDIVAAAGELDIPWLIVHGDADAAVSVAEGRTLYEAAGENAELLEVEGADHVFGARHPWAGATPELRTVAEATLEWFDIHLA